MSQPFDFFAELQSTLSGELAEAILNVAGGWAGGNASDKGETNRKHFEMKIKFSFVFIC